MFCADTRAYPITPDWKFIGALCFVMLSLFATIISSGQENRGLRMFQRNIEDFDSLKEYHGPINILAYNFSHIWTRTENQFVYGFIGSDYDRMRIKFLNVVRDSEDATQYFISGKTKVKDHICDFNGTMKIKHIYVFSYAIPGADTILHNCDARGAGIVYGEYHFEEDNDGPKAGHFDGKFVTQWVLDTPGILNYGGVSGADYSCNNLFIGTWRPYRPYRSKSFFACNWGDYRIPACGDLDNGVAEFAPDEKYIPNGWDDDFRKENAAKNSDTSVRKVDKDWWR